MPLTDRVCKTLKFTDKNFKRFDGQGLFLFVTRRGKYWRLKYRFGGCEKVLSIAQYPEFSLKAARTLAEDARISLASGIDPGAEKKTLKKEAEKSITSFESVARKRELEFTNKYKPAYAVKRMSRLERDVFPYIGSKKFTEITHQDMRGIIDRIVKRKAIDSAHRTLYQCNEVFQYAIADELCERNICVDIKGLLPPVKNGHLPAITDPKEIGPLLRVLDDYNGSEMVKIALKVAPLTFVRPMELRHAKWADIDLEKGTWSLDNAVLSALRRMDIPADKMCGHGFRAMARTVLDEVLEFEPYLIEQQLGHVVRDPNGRAYNRTKHLRQRTLMMQRWADYLDTLKNQHFDKKLDYREQSSKDTETFLLKRSGHVAKFGLLS